MNAETPLGTRVRSVISLVQLPVFVSLDFIFCTSYTVYGVGVEHIDLVSLSSFSDVSFFMTFRFF